MRFGLALAQRAHGLPAAIRLAPHHRGREAAPAVACDRENRGREAAPTVVCDREDGIPGHPVSAS
mgnify:CR=1 FL=1